MSKNNLFEIGLRLLGIYLLLQVPFAALNIGLAFTHDISEYYDNVLLYRTVIILSPFFLIVLSSILLFKASSIASFFIKDIPFKKKQPVPSESIYSLSFWIVLIGLFYFVSSIVKITAELIQFSVISPNWHTCGLTFSHGLALIFSVIFIFKSKKVAAFIKRISK